MLRDLLALLSEVVFAHHGTIDKFLGDGLIAVFGSPLPGPKDATNAARCALDIQRAIDRWNGRRRQAADGKPIRVGVGIHYGQVVLGDVGGDKRRSPCWATPSTLPAGWKAIAGRSTPPCW